MKVGLDSLKNHALNPTQTMAATLQEALQRSVVLSFHCIVAQMICMLCSEMCANDNGHFHETGTAVAPVPIAASTGSHCSYN